MRIIHLCGKVSDSCSITIENNDDKNDPCNGIEYDGYVPLDCLGGAEGDYIDLAIDAATGQILNWKAPSEKELLALNEDNEDYEDDE